MAKALNITLSIFGIILLLGVLGVLYMGYWQSNTIGENLVLNPGFEEIQSTNEIPLWIDSTSAEKLLSRELPSNWIPSRVDDSHEKVLDKTTAHNGLNSVKMVVEDGADKSWDRWQGKDIEVKPNTWYTTEYWYKAENLPVWNGEPYSSRLMLEWSYFDSNNIMDEYGYTSPERFGARGLGVTSKDTGWKEGDTGWTKVTSIVRTPANTAYANLRLFLYSNGGTVWFDDIIIKEAKSCTSNWQCTFDAECKDNQCVPLNCVSGFKQGFHKCNIILGETAGIQEPIQLSQD